MTLPVPASIKKWVEGKPVVSIECSESFVARPNEVVIFELDTGWRITWPDEKTAAAQCEDWQNNYHRYGG